MKTSSTVTMSLSTLRENQHSLEEYRKKERVRLVSFTPAPGLSSRDLRMMSNLRRIGATKVYFAHRLQATISKRDQTKVPVTKSRCRGEVRLLQKIWVTPFPIKQTCDLTEYF